MAKPSKDKRAIHQMLATNRDLREKVQRDSVGLTQPPKEENNLVWYHMGRRAYAAELLSIYREVEDEISGHNA